MDGWVIMLGPVCLCLPSSTLTLYACACEEQDGLSVCIPPAPTHPPKPSHQTNRETCIHFITDPHGLLFAALTPKAYPARVVFALLDELRLGFAAKHEPTALVTAKEGRWVGWVGGWVGG